MGRDEMRREENDSMYPALVCFKLILAVSALLMNVF
jgi:hypothetical protein